jgi:2-oxoisovalerate dehydrogenase E1 component alpha subunit
MAKAMPAQALERYGLADEQLHWMLRTMLLARTLDNRGFQLNRQGKIPFATGSEGHEAIHVGAALAFRRGTDVLVSYYRDMGLALSVGLEPLEALAALFARSADISGGRQFPNHFCKKASGILSVSSIIAAHCPHAVGAAYAMRYRKEEGRAVLCTFGEGATSEGEWHESVNFAAVHKLPIAFLCENNGWAISTPQSHQMAIPEVAAKASGYGIPGVTIDGADPLAVYVTVRSALDRARTGGGPSLVEAKCYRFLSHSTDDDDRTYRTRAEIEKHRAQDPIPRFERVLVEQGVMSEEEIAGMRRAVLGEVNELTDRVESIPYPAPSELYRNVYEGSHEPWL